MFLREFTQPLQIAITGRNAAHVGHDGFSNYGRQLMAMISHDALECGNVIPGREEYVVEGRWRNPFGIGDSGWIFSWPELLRRMAVGVQKKSVVPTVVVAFEL